MLLGIGDVLARLGLTGGRLRVAAVAIAVYILYLGVQAFRAEV